MPKSSIEFRTAKPTFDEGQVFARYLNQAAEGFFRFMLGRRSMDIIATAFTRPDHDLSYPLPKSYFEPLQEYAFLKYEEDLVWQDSKILSHIKSQPPVALNLNFFCSFLASASIVGYIYLMGLVVFGIRYCNRLNHI